jgi:hypothetical protein
MRSWKTSIMLGAAIAMLAFGLGTFSALAFARSPDAAPDCGTPMVDTIPCIESGHHDGVVQLNGKTRIGGLKVRAGNWFFVAKVVLTSSSGSPHTIPCTLTAGSNVDSAEAVLPPEQANTATMTVVQSFTSTSAVIVACTGTSGESASELRITGIRAGTLFDQEIS